LSNIKVEEKFLTISLVKENRMAISGALSSSLQIDSEKVLTFPHGIPGFEKYTTYLVYHKEENDLSAYWNPSNSRESPSPLLIPGNTGSVMTWN
jgi:hypothetical protein